MPRTFLAADLDPHFLDEVDALVASLREGMPSSTRWVERSAIHLTLRFFGASTSAQVDALRATVETIGAQTAPLLLTAMSVTAFPEESEARVLVIELAADEALRKLAGIAEQAAIALGFPPESRPYRPHVTLARFTQPTDIRPFARVADIGPARITATTLYASDAFQATHQYAVLARSTA